MPMPILQLSTCTGMIKGEGNEHDTVRRVDRCRDQLDTQSDRDRNGKVIVAEQDKAEQALVVTHLVLRGVSGELASR
jgi:hypothetical protein